MNAQENVITIRTLFSAFVETKSKAEREYGNRIMKISGYAVPVGTEKIVVKHCRFVEINGNKK